MDVLNILTERLKANFDFVCKGEYFWLPLKTYNQNNAERIFATLTLKNTTINKELSFSFSPRTNIEIEFYVTNCYLKQSMDLKHYLEFKEGLKPQYSPSYELDKEDMTGSTDLSNYFITSDGENLIDFLGKAMNTSLEIDEAVQIKSI